jgi:hypothetical protein
VTVPHLALTLGPLTDAQCAAAAHVIEECATSPADAEHLLDVLGLAATLILRPGGPASGQPLPPAVPGLCPRGEHGPEGPRACALAEDHDGICDLSRTKPARRAGG